MSNRRSENQAVTSPRRLNRRGKNSVATKTSTRTRAKERKPVQKKPLWETNEEERILRAATIHLIRKVGGLLVATAVRETRVRGRPVWIIAVTLRYPTGHEGY